MATVDRWLLPDGIEEVLPPEAALIEAARRPITADIPFVADCNNAHTLADIHRDSARWRPA